MDTFNDFVKFISDDPIMLGLCIAIIVLVLVFFIVLLFGGKKKKNETSEYAVDNTTEILKSSLSEEPLRSTQEFTLNGLDKTQKVESVEALVDAELEKTVPISIEEAMSLKNEREDALVKDTIPVPVVNEEVKEEVEIPLMKEENIPQVEPEIPAIETPTVTQPFSSVVVNSGDEFPKVDEDFSKTEIIRHAPVMEVSETETIAKINVPEMEETVSETKVEDNTASDDDIALPKLNTNNENSVLNSLTGESFDL